MLPIVLAASLLLQPSAPSPPPPDDGTSAVVEELEVMGRLPGPAMWRVRKGGAEVVILGAISPLPHSLAWDHGRVERALAGAKVLLVPPAVEVKPWDVPGLLFKLNAVKSATPLEARLAPALRTRFLAAAAAARQPPKRYAGYKPAAAATRLVADFREANGLSNAKPASTVERLAKAARVPVKSYGALRAVSLLDAVARVPDTQQMACFEAGVADVEQEAAHARAAAEAWAVGRIAEARALSASPALDRCAGQLPTVQAAVERGTADATRAMADALASPGRSVAVVDLRYLTRANGLLDRLKAQGAQISVPTN